MNNPRNHSDLCHTWAHNDISKRVGNIVADGDVIYSYGYHFPMARKIMRWNNVAPNQRINFLITTRTYSVSTAKHLSYTHRALHGRIVAVPDVNANSAVSHLDNMVYLMEQTFESAEKCKRARTYARFHAIDAQTRWREFEQYRANFFKRGFVKMFNKQRRELWERFRKLDQSFFNQLEIEAGEKSIAEKEREKVSFDLALSNWRSFKRKTLPHTHRTFLRLNENYETIETSKGVTLSKPISLMLYRRVLMGRIKAEERKTDSEFVLVHNFGYGEELKVYANGDVSMGCHFIEWSEIDAMAEELGLKDAPRIEVEAQS